MLNINLNQWDQGTIKSNWYDRTYGVAEVVIAIGYDWAETVTGKIYGLHGVEK